MLALSVRCGFLFDIETLSDYCNLESCRLWTMIVPYVIHDAGIHSVMSQKKLDMAKCHMRLYFVDEREKFLILATVVRDHWFAPHLLPPILQYNFP